MRLQLDIRSGYLHVEVRGPFDAEEGRMAIGRIIETCAAHKLARVLVDARGLEQTVAIAERFELARVLADARAGPLKMAILVDPSQLVTKTLEDTACNRGVPVRTTASAEEAYGFLGVAPPG
ncbi:MAG: hypothetical protein IPP91_04020 [Betaproteobacteria bacterium]|nr:hypothetical protein [Betaproteobacteria bacterium]